MTTSPSAIAVYCASSPGKQKAFQDAAVSLGTVMAQTGRPLVYGGGNKGLMGIISSAVAKQGGHVTGIMPYAMVAAGGEKIKIEDNQEKDRNMLDVLSTCPDSKVEMVIVDSMHERKVEMAKRVAGFVALPGGYGTYEEVLEVVTWTQLGIHAKPVVLLNVLSYYSPLRELIRNGVQQGFIEPANEALVTFVDGPSDLSEHASFDWGSAALNALDSWTRDTSVIYSFDWSNSRHSEGEKNEEKLENS